MMVLMIEDDDGAHDWRSAINDLMIMIDDGAVFMSDGGILVAFVVA